MSLPDFKVSRVMSRRDFYGAGSKFHINCFVGNHFYFSRTQKSFNFYFFTKIFFITFVFWINGYGRIAEFCFWSHRSQLYWPVFYIKKRVYSFFVFYFQIRKRSLMLNAPVNHPFSPINQPIVKKFFKSLINYFYNIRVKSEFFPAPVAGSAELFKLAFHYFFIFLGKIPNHFVKYFPRKLKTALPLFFQLFFKNHLGLKTRVVSAREP